MTRIGCGNTWPGSNWIGLLLRRADRDLSPIRSRWLRARHDYAMARAAQVLCLRHQE
jgi:hypothetical protein